MAVDMEKVEMTFLDNEERMDKVVNALKNEYLVIRVGRANPHVLDKVLVDYYGQMTPVNQTSNISVQEGKCLVISPWDKSMLKNVEKAIIAANLGITPTNDGSNIRLVFPDLTSERRIEISKQVKKLAENSKVAVRNVRRDTLDAFKKMKTAKEITEDEYTNYEADVNELTDKNVSLIEKLATEKEKEVMTI